MSHVQTHAHIRTIVVHMRLFVVREHLYLFLKNPSLYWTSFRSVLQWRNSKDPFFSIKKKNVLSLHTGNDEGNDVSCQLCVKLTLLPKN